MSLAVLTLRLFAEVLRNQRTDDTGAGVTVSNSSALAFGVMTSNTGSRLSRNIGGDPCDPVLSTPPLATDRSFAGVSAFEGRFHRFADCGGRAHGVHAGRVEG